MLRYLYYYYLSKHADKQVLQSSSVRLSMPGPCAGPLREKKAHFGSESDNQVRSQQQTRGPESLESQARRAFETIHLQSTCLDVNTMTQVYSLISVSYVPAVYILPFNFTKKRERRERPGFSDKNRHLNWLEWSALLLQWSSDHTESGNGKPPAYIYL